MFEFECASLTRSLSALLSLRPPGVQPGRVRVCKGQGGAECGAGETDKGECQRGHCQSVKVAKGKLAKVCTGLVDAAVRPRHYQ